MLPSYVEGTVNGLEVHSKVIAVIVVTGSIAIMKMYLAGISFTSTALTG